MIDTHPFNQALTVFLPGCSINLANEHFNQKLGYYYQVESPLSILLDLNFFKTFFQSDQYNLMMHTLNTNLNTDNVIVLDPEGNLSLSLVKDAYEKFGIQVQHRSKASMKHNKYIINIPLKDNQLHPGSKQFERLKWCLENTLTQTFKLVFAATDKVTGQSVDIEWPSQVKKVTKIDIEPQFETLTDIHIPSFESINHSLNSQPAENWDRHVMNALEWIGLAYIKSNRIKARITKAVDPFISVYKAPVPFLDSQTGTLIKWKGFLPTSFIHNVMTMIRKLMVPDIINHWTSLTVYGYRDSPYTWKGKEHYAYLNSENDYTFLMMPEHQTAYTLQFYGSHHSNV
ncbi:unnamed protein product [Rhizopus microsporus]